MPELIRSIKKSFTIRRIVRSYSPFNEAEQPQSTRPFVRAREHLPLSARILKSPPVTRQDSSQIYIVFKESKRRSNIRPPLTDKKAKVMHSHVQFITTPTADTPGTALLLHFDNKRYIIGNISEGVQRACIQRHVGLSKVEDLFLTGKVDWATTGGILGMVLTLADIMALKLEEPKRLEALRQAEDDLEQVEEALKQVEKPKAKKNSEKNGKQSLEIHGGKNLTHMLATARRFIFRKGMPLHIHEIREEDYSHRQDWSPTWSDSNIKVWAMVSSPEGSSSNPARASRKRSSDEISEDFERPVDLDGTPVQETKEETENRYHQMRKAVVDHMFGSTWTLDALTKMRLSEVQLPATLFVRSQEGKIKTYEGPWPGGNQPVPDIDVLVRKPWPAALISSLPPTKPSKSAISYIIKGHNQRGKFDPKKARELGVRPGPDFGKLTNGIDVPGKDGTIVRPEMVLDPEQLGRGLAVLEIPSNEYIDPVLNRPEWGVKDIMGTVGGVIWILGAGVKVEGRVHKFMVEHPEWEHIVSSPDYCPNNLALESPAASAIRLHQIDSDHFPVPVHSNVSTAQWNGEGSNSARPFHLARVGQSIGIFPNVTLQNENITQDLDTAAVVNEASPELLELAESAQKEVSDPAFLANLEELQKDIPSKDAEVTALGTGSALPSKYRNVSATLVRVPGYGNYLLDCGENTLGQLKRVFGKDLPSVLQNLKMIWISHLHADHHLGTVSVIKAWHEETAKSEQRQQDRLVVASDQAMLDWLEEYAAVEDFGLERVESLSLSPENNFFQEFTSPQVDSWGLKSIEACRVAHCKGALAVALNFPNGFKVAYSGDCRPSNDFVNIGKGATLLIHEATFDDELQDDAMAKKHSTTSEALDVGKRMGARRILLTHFSQRYQKIPVMSEEGGTDDVKAGVCFDYMKVEVGDIAKLEAFRPALMKLLEEKDSTENEESTTEPAVVPMTAKARRKAQLKKAAEEIDVE